MELLARFGALLVVGSLSVCAIAISTRADPSDEEGEESDGGPASFFLLPLREVSSMVVATAPITVGLITEELVSCIINLISENADWSLTVLHVVDISFSLLLFAVSAKFWGGALAAQQEHHVTADAAQESGMQEPLVAPDAGAVNGFSIEDDSASHHS